MNKLIITSLLLGVTTSSVCKANAIVSVSGKESKTKAVKERKLKNVERLNIIVILSDDAGYADFGFTGSKQFKTPNIDRLARNGITFTSAYVTASVCGPSRAGLLTGRYQQRFGFIHNNVPGCVNRNAGLWGESMGLPKDQQTIANFLGKQGYQSMIIGKWHQGHGEGYHPLDRGFDHFYGFLGGARSYFTPKRTTPENQLWNDRIQIKEPGGYLTDHLGDKACNFISDNTQNPFFLFLSFNAVHSPFEAKETDLKGQLNLKGGRKTLASMTASMDNAIGKVMQTLKEHNLEENTLIIFTNDNGGTSYYHSDNTPFSGTKATNLEGGNRVPFIISWKGHLRPGTFYDYPISTLDILPTSLTLAGTNQLPTNLDGVDLMPYLVGEKEGRPHETLYWMVDGPFAAIRDLDWKLILMPDRLPELYNLADDPSETNNLIDLHRDTANRLLKQLYQWQNQMEPARWQLYKKYEKSAIERFDNFRK
ncbi:sulfatase [Puteibacter caeruleilacunae]|nr:sulfatase [Puteibacter caeruleilacunae]